MQGLLQSLADGLAALREHCTHLIHECRTQTRVACADSPERLAARSLHRLVQSCNKRMHKGFPEICCYLVSKPMFYTSHKFVRLDCTWRLYAIVSAVAGKSSAADTVTGPVQAVPVGSGGIAFTSLDYTWRSASFDTFHLYVFEATTSVTSRATAASLLWFEQLEGDLVRRHPCYRDGDEKWAVRAALANGGVTTSQVLLDPHTRASLFRYDHYREYIQEACRRVPMLAGWRIHARGLLESSYASRMASQKAR